MMNFLAITNFYLSTFNLLAFLTTLSVFLGVLITWKNLQVGRIILLIAGLAFAMLASYYGLRFPLSWSPILVIVTGSLLFNGNPILPNKEGGSGKAAPLVQIV